MVDHVVLAQLGALDAFTTAVLGAVFVGFGAFDEAGMGDRYDDVLFGDQVFDVHLARIRQDAGTAFVAVLFDDFVKFVAHDLTLAFRLGEDVVVIGDLALQFLVFVENLLPFEGGETAQLHREDRVRLHVIDVQQVLQAFTGGVHVLGGTDEGDDLVDHVEGFEIALQDVIAFFSLTLQIPGTTFDDVKLMGDPVADERVQAERARHTVDQGEHIGTESLLELGMLVQVVEHDLGDRVTLEHEHQTLAGTAGGFVAHVGDALDFAVTHRFADGDDQTVRVDLIGQLGNHQAHTPVDFLRVDHGTHGDQATAGAVRLFDALVAENSRSGREVRPLDAFDERVEQFFAARVRMVERPMYTVSHFAQVVRRDVGGHADGDAGGTVDQQVREAAGQYGRLLGFAIVVGHEIDGVFVDVTHHFHGEGSHTAFGVTHGGRRIVARGAEVALAVHKRVSHGPRLGHTHERVVDGGVAVWMIFTHDVADDAGALVVAAVGTVAAVVHRVDDATMDRLHAVTHVRQCAFHDDG